MSLLDLIFRRKPKQAPKVTPSAPISRMSIYQHPQAPSTQPAAHLVVVPPRVDRLYDERLGQSITQTGRSNVRNMNAPLYDDDDSVTNLATTLIVAEEIAAASQQQDDYVAPQQPVDDFQGGGGGTFGGGGSSGSWVDPAPAQADQTYQAPDPAPEPDRNDYSAPDPTPDPPSYDTSSSYDSGSSSDN